MPFVRVVAPDYSETRVRLGAAEHNATDSGARATPRLSVARSTSLESTGQALARTRLPLTDRPLSIGVRVSASASLSRPCFVDAQSPATEVLAVQLRDRGLGL